MRRTWPSITVLAALLLVGCGGGGPAPGRTASGPGTTAAGDFDPASSSEMYLPAATASLAAPAPVLVLIPGGGWSSADRSGLVPLAESLAQAGYAVLNATYRTAGDGVHFPVPVQDVECDAAFAVAQARQRGITPDGVVLIGHSAGGHLAALAAVSGDDFSTGCPYPSVAIDGLVGLAGVYDTAAFDDVVETFFGMPRADDPSRWESGDPLHYVESGQAPDGLHVLLLHGDADSLVPVSQSRQFADALTRAGIDTSYAALPGETHGSLYTAPVAAPRIVTWLRSLPEP